MARTPAREKDMSHSILSKNNSEKTFLKLRIKNRKLFDSNSKNFQNIKNSIKNRLKQHSNEPKPSFSSVYPNAIRNAEERLGKIKNMFKDAEGHSAKPHLKSNPTYISHLIVSTKKNQSHLSKYIKSLKQDTKHLNSRQSNQLNSLKFVESITQNVHTNSPNLSSTTIKSQIQVKLPGYNHNNSNSKSKISKKLRLDKYEYPNVFKDIQAFCRVFE